MYVYMIWMIEANTAMCIFFLFLTESMFQNVISLDIFFKDEASIMLKT